MQRTQITASQHIEPDRQECISEARASAADIDVSTQRIEPDRRKCTESGETPRKCRCHKLTTKGCANKFEVFSTGCSHPVRCGVKVRRRMSQEHSRSEENDASASII